MNTIVKPQISQMGTDEELPCFRAKVRDEKDWEKIALLLELGKEYAQECLAEREARFGRATRSNRVACESIETDIERFLKAIALLSDNLDQDLYDRFVSV